MYANKRRRRVVAALLAGLGLFASACTDPAPVLVPGADEVPGPGGGGVVGVNPNVTSTPGAVKKAVTYGPYTVPAAKGPGHDQEGMINPLVFDVEKPCTNCFITSMQTNLKYTDGRVANIDTGQWLHHTIFASSAWADATCTLNGFGLLGERFFATGNERTRAQFPVGYGYQVGVWDAWSVAFEIMNSTSAPTNVVVETTFEWVPASTPGMIPLRPVWMDASNHCIYSTVPPRTGSYGYTTDWSVNRPGKVIGVGHHVHDGATHIDVTNTTTGELICRGIAGYGGPGYVEPEPPGDHGHPGGSDATAHVSSITSCIAPSGDKPVANLAWGQNVKLSAYYNTDIHAQMGNHPVMGIAIIYTAAR
jgi:hypothetical protein